MHYVGACYRHSEDTLLGSLPGRSLQCDDARSCAGGFRHRCPHRGGPLWYIASNLGKRVSSPRRLAGRGIVARGQKRRLSEESCSSRRGPTAARGAASPPRPPMCLPSEVEPALQHPKALLGRLGNLALRPYRPSTAGSVCSRPNVQPRQHTPGCEFVPIAHRDGVVGHRVDAYGLACPWTGLLARRPKIVERAWVGVARQAVEPDGQVVPQQWLAHTTALGRLGEGVRCAVTQPVVFPLTSLTHAELPQTGAVLRVAERRKQSAYPELSHGGPQQLVVLGSEVDGRWNAEAQRFLCDRLRVRLQTAPPALCAAASVGWFRRWMSLVGHAERGRAAWRSRGQR